MRASTLTMVMPDRKLVLPAFLVVAAGSTLLWLWTRFADLWTPSVAFYAGLMLALAGLVSVIVPLRFTGIGTRRAGALVTLSGVLIGIAALMWPVPQAHKLAGGSTEFDRIMPEFDRGERHEIRLRGESETVRRAAEEVTFSDIRGLQALLSLRAAKKVKVAPMPVLAAMTRPGGGFTLLARTDGEFVAGNIGRPWNNERPNAIRDAREFRSFVTPGYAKVAFNLRVEAAEPGWCKVITETRVLATDDSARQAFIRYWRVVYPGSALIRVLWLDAIQRRLYS